MSRIGKKTIVIPEKTEVALTDGLFSVKGPEGSLQKDFKNSILIKIEDKDGGKVINLEPKSHNGETKSLWGTYASHITNMIKGVNTPYEKKLVVEGVGFKSDIQPARSDDQSGGGDKLVMSLGFSHPVEMVIPKDLKATAQKNLITISGIDKESVGQFAAKVRAKKKPEPYKGKGIRYDDEVIRRKQGKKAA
jgi:large subunit ribosomal protein L6